MVLQPRVKLTSHPRDQIKTVMDKRAKGGKRRYLDTVPPEEYRPETGEVILSELSLTGLADLYGSDKGTLKHNYTEVYARLIDELLAGGDRRKAKLKIVEFGVACAASLRMWANYLPHSDIVGLDIREACGQLCGDLPNVRIEICDPTQWNTEEVFDLVVDDASHISEQIVSAVRSCWPKVRPGGAYVVEDLACTYSEEYAASYRNTFKTDAANDRGVLMALMDELMRITDVRGDVAEVHYYPQLLIIKKRSLKNS